MSPAVMAVSGPFRGPCMLWAEPKGKASVATVLCAIYCRRFLLAGNLAGIDRYHKRFTACMIRIAGPVATPSAQIAAGNMDLCSRTEQQASCLEETTSSMEEPASTVKLNSDNTR